MLTNTWNHNSITTLCQQSLIGKKLPSALYVHKSALVALDRNLQDYAAQARVLLPNLSKFTLIKFSYEQPKISFLLYPNFDTDPHPSLHTSIQIDLEAQELHHRDYSTSNNPPVLHRKETFVTSDYPLYREFAELTRQEEAIGLLRETRTIGTRNG